MKLSGFAFNALNDERLIAAREKWFARLRNLFDGKYTDGNVFAVNGFTGITPLGWLPFDQDADPEFWVIESLEALSKSAGRIQNDVMFVPPCLECGPCGVHYIDKILGANVYYSAGQWYNDYLKTPVGELEMPDVARNKTFLLSINAAKAFVKQNVKLPLYGLPTIASPLNIAVNLYGGEILMEMLANPETAARDLRVITDVLKYIHTEFIKALPFGQLQPVLSFNRTQPPGYGQVCGCTTQLVSAETYKEMVAPLDEEILNLYPHGGMIHLCGRHTQHISTFRGMKSLRSVQLNDAAAKDLEVYFKELRKDQIIYLNPCADMPIDKAMEITKGERLVIADTISNPLPRNL